MEKVLAATVGEGGGVQEGVEKRVIGMDTPTFIQHCLYIKLRQTLTPT